MSGVSFSDIIGSLAPDQYYAKVQVGSEVIALNGDPEKRSDIRDLRWHWGTLEPLRTQLDGELQTLIHGLSASSSRNFLALIFRMSGCGLSLNTCGRIPHGPGEVSWKVSEILLSFLPKPARRRHPAGYLTTVGAQR
jgi:hypothetical protein